MIPVRKEVDRTKNTEFKKQNDDFKANKFQDSMNKNDFSGIRKVYSQKIEIDDELIVNKCDAILYGANESTSGGSFGELQQASLLRKPIFTWYMNDWKISGHSPWNLPHVCKIIRSDMEMEEFIFTMINYAKRNK